MKNRLIFALLLVGYLLVSTFETFAKDPGFIVKGRIKNFNQGRIITLYTGPDHELYKIDTIEVKNGSFTYKGSVDEPKMIYFYFDNVHEKLSAYGINVFMENSKISIDADLKNLKKAVVKGSKNHKEFEQLMSGTELFEDLANISGKISMAMKDNQHTQVDSLKLKRYEMLDSAIDYLQSKKGFEYSAPSAFIIYNHIGSILDDNEKLKAVLDTYSADIQASVYFKFLYFNIQKDAELAIGQPAPDFELFDFEGNSYKLSDFKGQLVLLDFGASWCHWCKKQKPYLENAYNKFADKGLQIIYISLDKDREAWKMDLEKEKYKWLALSDLKAWQGDVAKKYNIQGVPHIFLINREGKIVESDARGPRMEEAILENM